MHEDALERGIASERFFHRSGRNSLAIGGTENGSFHPPGLHDLDPALAELSGRTDKHFVAGRKEILCCRFETARTRRHQNQHVVRSAKHKLEIGQHLFVQIAEIFGPVMNVGAHHGVKGCGQDGSWAGCKESLLFNVHEEFEFRVPAR